MGGGSGEYLARRLFFTLETNGASVALADQIRTLEDTPPGGVRVSFATSDPGPGAEADGVILVDGADGTWAVERARGLHEAGFHGLVVAVSPVVKRDVLVAGFAAGVHLWESPPIDAEVFAANLDSLVRRILGDDAELELPVVLNRPKRELVLDHRSVKLGPRGFDCFSHLLERRGRWVKAEEIMRAVFRTHHAVDSAVVRVLIARMRETLGDLAWVLEGREGFGYRVVLRPDSTPGRLRLPHARYHARKRSLE